MLSCEFIVLFDNNNGSKAVASCKLPCNEDEQLKLQNRFAEKKTQQHTLLNKGLLDW